MQKILVALSVLWGLTALAQTPAASCDAQAAEKKLAGAAKTSFLTKCEREAAAAAPRVDPQAACEQTAAERKLAGAAKTSFVTKCVKDATAAK